jgi:hypothetical protein
MKNGFPYYFQRRHPWYFHSQDFEKKFPVTSPVVIVFFVLFEYDKTITFYNITYYTESRNTDPGPNACTFISSVIS